MVDFSFKVLIIYRCIHEDVKVLVADSWKVFIAILCGQYGFCEGKILYVNREMSD